MVRQGTKLDIYMARKKVQNESFPHNSQEELTQPKPWYLTFGLCISEWCNSDSTYIER